MMADLLTIARVEMTAAARLNWIRLVTAAFALLAGAAAYSSGAADDLSGADGFARTTVTLVPVVLILVPLAAVILAVSGQSNDPDVQPFLFAQPVSRIAVLVGRWLGEAVALGGAVAAGLSIGAIVIAFASGIHGIGGFALFGAASIALAVIFLSLGAAIAVAAERRVAALGAAVFVWFLFVLLYDGAMLSVAGHLTSRIGGRVLLASTFGNPADLVRIVTLSWAGTPNVLGAAGDAWLRFLGGSAMAGAVAVAALAAWALAPLGVAARLLSARDL
jgi:Cu-processing system permease protein